MILYAYASMQWNLIPKSWMMTTKYEYVPRGGRIKRAWPWPGSWAMRA